MTIGPTKKALRIAKTTAIVTGKIGLKIGKELWNNRGKAIEAVNYIKKQISKSSPEKRYVRIVLLSYKQFYYYLIFY